MIKMVRTSIILATLALAGFAGTSDGASVRSAACTLDGVAHALSGSASSGTCQP
jgi:hypothetical protein